MGRALPLGFHCRGFPIAAQVHGILKKRSAPLRLTVPLHPFASERCLTHVSSRLQSRSLAEGCSGSGAALAQAEGVQLPGLGITPHAPTARLRAFRRAGIPRARRGDEVSHCETGNFPGGRGGAAILLPRPWGKVKRRAFRGKAPYELDAGNSDKHRGTGSISRSTRAQPVTATCLTDAYKSDTANVYPSASGGQGFR